MYNLNIWRRALITITKSRQANIRGRYFGLTEALSNNSSLECGYWTEPKVTCRPHRIQPNAYDGRDHLNILWGDFFLYILISPVLEPYLYAKIFIYRKVNNCKKVDILWHHYQLLVQFLLNHLAIYVYVFLNSRWTMHITKVSKHTE